VVQIAPWAGFGTLAEQAAGVRDEELRTTLADAHATLATAADLGDLGAPMGSIHPRPKQQLGARLAAGALLDLFGIGRATDSRGPVARAARAGGGAAGSMSATVTFGAPFDAAGSLALNANATAWPGLAPSSICPPTSSAVCGGFALRDGASGAWHNATAALNADASALVLTAPSAPEGAAANETSLGFAVWPQLSLFADASVGGLPAYPWGSLAVTPAPAALAGASAAWSTFFGYENPCAGPYDVAASIFAVTHSNATAPAVVSKGFDIAPLLMSSVGGIWAALSVDGPGNRAWHTWCTQDGTVFLTQASFEGGAPKIDGVCRIPLILDGITYFDARVDARGPFMFWDNKIMSFFFTNSTEAAKGGPWPAQATAGLRRPRPRRARRADRAAASSGAPRILREGEPFVPDAASLTRAELERIAAFAAATQTCGWANVSEFSDFAGSWMMRFDGGALPSPTALTLSDAEESNDGIVATFYDVLTGSPTAATQRMPFNCTNGEKPCFGEYAWMEWRKETVLLSGDDDFREGASFVALGEPQKWAASPASAALATLDGIGAEGTSSFTQSFEAASGARVPFPVLLQQVTDNSFSCKASPTTDQVVGFEVAEGGVWAETAAGALQTCPPFGGGGAHARSCMTPLVVAMEPLVPQRR